MTTISNEVFNVEKVSYEGTPLFLGERPGLFDTVNKRYPKIWDLYKRMKSLDWDENEFDFKSCLKDFQTCNKSVYDMMIKTLAWQWEADSVASRSIAPIVAPFVSSSELWAAWQRVSDNETLHAATYSEIVRCSFEDPQEVIAEVLAVKESLSRLKTIATAIENARVISHEVGQGKIDRNDPNAYKAIFMFTCALLCLERIQFMSSFAITFAIAETGLFLAIGKAVQKICQDEFEVHVELDKAILETELKTRRGQDMFAICSSDIKSMIDEVVQSEIDWTNYAFSEGRELAGLTPDLLIEGVKWNAADVYRFFGFEVPYESQKKNPLGYMEDWVNISLTQPSPQEEKTGQYLLGAVVDTAGDRSYTVDF